MLTIDEERFLNIPKLSNMKILSIKSTVYPTGEKIEWEGCRMQEHKYYAMDSELFNRWNAYIHNQLLKCRMWNNIIGKIKTTNTVRKGGVGYIEGQESALMLAKEILR